MLETTGRQITSKHWEGGRGRTKDMIRYKRKCTKDIIYKGYVTQIT
jgi:hypothetical protein